MAELRYFKYPDDESLIGGTTYAETRNGCHIREICFNGSEYFASNVKRPPWGLCLAEGQIDYDDLMLMPEFSEITEITKQEFDGIWNAHLATRQEIWNQVKQTYPIGIDIQGKILIFFPQGTIVDLGGDAIGVADYKASRASNEAKYFGSRLKMTAVVKDYDETNQWLVLDLPHVYDERIERPSI